MSDDSPQQPWGSPEPEAGASLDERELALRSLKAKRDFRSHLFSYLVVNGGLVLIWLATGGGYFWPVWPVLGWGIGLAFHARETYGAPSRQIGEAEIAAEIERRRRRI